MIEINLLGHVKPSRQFSAPSWLSLRNILVLLLIASLGYVGVDYLPLLLEPDLEEAAPPASIEDILAEAERLRAEMTPPAETPAPAPEEPTPAPPAQAEPAPAPVPPPPVTVQTEPAPPPAPVPAPVGDLATLLRHSRQLVRTYAALYAAVLPGSQYELLSVGDDRFFTELWSSERVLLQKYQGRLKRTLPEGRLFHVGPVQQDLETSVFRAQIWGKSEPGDGETTAPAQYDNAQIVIQKISALARQHSITMKTATTHQTLNGDGLQRIPVSLKFQGNDARSLSFLRSLDAQGWNVAIQKISAQPTEGHIQMQMNLSVDVLVPAG